MLVVLCVALLFGAVVRVALADHWHAWCSSGGSAYHGLVHGGSSSDNTWRSQIENSCGNYTKYCEVGSVGAGSMGYAVETYNTCDRRGDGGYTPAKNTECWGWSYVDYANRFSGHYHYAHNRCIQT